MDKLSMQSESIIKRNISIIEENYPNCIVETIDASGRVNKSVDFDMLKQQLKDVLVEGSAERYVMTWPDKRKAVLSANITSTKTLRPSADESVNFDSTKNLYIEGDNLETLKLIRETYSRKIKLVYLDPPYNAGADLLYKNNYEMTETEFLNANYDLNEDGYVMSLNTDTSGRFHTDWLNMMYPRLLLARDLLTEDGCIVIAIDHNELANIVKVADEVFSERNRIGIVTIVHKPEGRNQERYFATSNEFALFYAKNIDEFDFEKVIIDEEIAKSYTQQDNMGAYKLISFIAKNHGRNGYDKNLRENSPKKFFPIYVSPDLTEITLDDKPGYISVLPITSSQERTWKYIRETCEQKIKTKEIVAMKDNDGTVRLFEKYREDKGQLIKTHWTDKKYNAMVYGTKLLDDLMKTKTFDFPKSLYLMKDIVNLTTHKDSYVLDMFSGSATTAHATMLLNSEDGGVRKFVMLQLPWACDEQSDAFKSGYANICEIGKERIRRAGQKISNESPLTTNTLDIGFRDLKLDSSNMKDVYYKPAEYQQNLLDSMENNIKEDRCSTDLLFQVMIELGKPLESTIQKISIFGKEVFVVNTDDLVCCFDTSINDDVITEIAKKQPLYAVFRDSGLTNDSVGANFDQIFASYSPNTIRRVL